MAKRISKIIKPKCSIFIKKSNDPRSYRQNSDRIIREGFKPQKKIEDAINEIKENFLQKKIIKYYNKKKFKITKIKWVAKRIDQIVAKLLKKTISYLISFRSQVPLTTAVNIMQ